MVYIVRQVCEPLKHIVGLAYSYNKTLAYLDSVGMGPIPIGESHVATFESVGLTSPRQLKHAAIIDEFMRNGTIQANNESGMIIADLNNSYDRMIALTDGHEDSLINARKWRRQIDRQIDILSQPWDPCFIRCFHKRRS